MHYFNYSNNSNFCQPSIKNEIKKAAEDISSAASYLKFYLHNVDITKY